ncbi:patatin-like phospholipase family protein [Ancylobacter sp. A5.8]|uniref:patatin-like phospholipase family protein n=1 Tax=Ancylobacter gelatini TaxID=2919920 RepID=UPI001F4E5161|nr:patatin-like phospholipase family protein [Ancylobacter gelatini]MCJ8141768.1 patatin-like phospholipase family protein [Ancylobacter gelatini]
MFRIVVVAIIASLCLGGCIGSDRSRALPYAALDKAHIPDYGLVRFWADENSPVVEAYVDAQLRQVRASGCRECRTTANFLAISGGGEEGAFAAGLLNGWSMRGNRPEFEVVTGVSTGSLAAPFAFLGTGHDATLRRVYTQITDRDVYVDKGAAGLIGDALYDSSPLRRLIGLYVTEALLDEIAREHRNGRRLLVQTTNIDAQRPVIWDMGAIASGGGFERRRLFIDVLLASAAIPAVFPPVSIDVQSGGRSYEELHVDGGVTSQITFGPPGLDLRSAERRIFGRVRGKTLYVIRNGKLQPEYDPTDRTVAALAKRAVGTMVKYQTLADIADFSRRSQAEDIELRLVAIPEGFSDRPSSEFDRAYMNRLFQLGEEIGARGDFWRAAPSGSVILSRAMQR